jgi:RNA polymerase sigma-70 factor (ECF subfamily)
MESILSHTINTREEKKAVTDHDIIKLYETRDESAINKTEIKYGKILTKISYGVLNNLEDSKECVNDTYLKAWNSIPPASPENLMAYLGRIVRNISLNRRYSSKTKKRGGDFMMTELTDCIPAADTVESVIEEGELSAAIAVWLKSLPKEDRLIFMRRYWFAESLESLASELLTTPNKLAGRIYRLRQKLKSTLERQGIKI